MGKTSNLVIGIALGAAVGVVINYLFGPTLDAEFNSRYQSRWDRAIAEGKQAEAEREAELRQQLVKAQQQR